MPSGIEPVCGVTEMDSSFGVGETDSRFVGTFPPHPDPIRAIASPTSNEGTFRSRAVYGTFHCIVPSTCSALQRVELTDILRSGS
jgi:hypothetical protein